VIDGDDILYLLAKHWQQTGRLRGPVVGTVMTNFGIEQAFQNAGITFMRAKVGDRYVHEMLKQHGGILGGEASGHVLCLDRVSTGDAIVSALQVLEVLARTGANLRTLLAGVQRVPQVMINVRVDAGSKPLASEPVRVALAAAEAQMGDQGRVVLRASGTEPLVRVTVEGRDASLVQQVADRLADVVKAASSV
jgi:phosphoglucosamine mutase